MKTLTFGLSLVCLTLASFASTAAAQGYDRRIDIPRIVNPDRALRDRGDWELRRRAELDRLNREVREVRRAIGNLRDRHLRARFYQVVRATERLNAASDNRQITYWELRRRADRIREQLDGVRRELRAHLGRRH